MFKQMLEYIRRHPILWIVGLVLPALASFTVNFGFALSLDFYTAELSQKNASFSNILIIMAVTACSLVIAVIIEDISRFIFSKFIIKTQNNMRHDVDRSFINTKYALRNNTDRGEFYTSYNIDTEMATKVISEDLFAILFPLVHAIGYFIALFVVNPLIGGLVSGLTITIILLNLLFVNKFNKLEKEVLSAKEDFTRITDTAVRGKITVRQLQIGDTFTQKISDKSDSVYNVGKKSIRLNFYRKITLEFLSIICTSLITPVACILAALNIIELASVVMIAQICRFIIMQTNGLGTAIQQLGIHFISYNRMQKILQLPNEYEKSINNTEIISSLDFDKPAIAFKNFGIYYNENTILEDINISVDAGQIIAIVGPSGSGKTSIVNALLGLIEYSGDIQIFGVNARDLDLHTLRNCFTYSPEHSQLFDDASILDNLLYINSDKNYDEIKELLNYLLLQDLDITQKPHTLSGGQRLRVSLARALLKNSQIIILDEPTSALDSESEDIVLKVILSLKKLGKTILLISHRGSTIKSADKFLIVSNKHVYQYNSFEEANKLYSNSDNNNTDTLI